MRSAARRVPAVRLTDAQRQKLAGLLETAMHRAETRLRDRFRPAVARTLDEVGLDPRNLPEKVACKKLVEELLDRVVETRLLDDGRSARRPFAQQPQAARLRLARATCSAAIRCSAADRRLTASLDGVYRGGEFYLRWMQRLSSLGFGTPAGRLVTRYRRRPLRRDVSWWSRFWITWSRRSPASEPAAARPSWSVLRILLLGTFVLGLVNVEWFRRGVWQTVVDVCGGARRRGRRSGPMDRATGSGSSGSCAAGWRGCLPLRAQAAGDYGGGWIALPMEAVGWQTSAPSGVGLFLAINLFLNSRLGREVEELLVDGLMQAWRRLGMPILTGLFYFFVDFFRGILETRGAADLHGRRMAPVPHRRDPADVRRQGRARARSGTW